MDTATIRIPENKKNMLKAVSSLENRKINEIVVELIEEYLQRHKETVEILSIPGLYDRIAEASEEFRKGQGIRLKNARKVLER
jgi:predicted DNA-binding protein